MKVGKYWLQKLFEISMMKERDYVSDECGQLDHRQTLESDHLGERRDSRKS